jgi:hypothetical protein
MMAATLANGMPLPIITEAAVCLRSWKRMCGMPAFLLSLWKSSVILVSSCGLPTIYGNTRSFSCQRFLAASLVRFTFSSCRCIFSTIPSPISMQRLDLRLSTSWKLMTTSAIQGCWQPSALDTKPTWPGLRIASSRSKSGACCGRSTGSPVSSRVHWRTWSNNIFRYLHTTIIPGRSSCLWCKITNNMDNHALI